MSASGWTLVTGAAQGLGSAICLRLAKDGHPLVIHYRTNQLKAEALKKQCIDLGAQVELIAGNFESESLTAHFLEEYQSRFKATKNLINNVGNYQVQTLLKTSIGDINKLYQTNLFSPIQIIQALIPSISFLSGSIINIGVAGIQSIPADIYAPAYTSSKLGLWMATKSLAKELASKKVRVNMISPGYLENAVDLPKDLSILPQGKAVSFREIADMAAFLLDENNGSITGQNIEIAGGIRL